MCQQIQIKSFRHSLTSLFKFCRHGASSITPRSFPAQMFKICGVNLRRQARSQLFLSRGLAKLRGQAIRTSAHSRTESAAIGLCASNKGADLRQFAGRPFWNLSPLLSKCATQFVQCLESAKTSGLITKAQNMFVSA